MPQNPTTFNALLAPNGLRAAGWLQAGPTRFVSENGSDVNYSGVSRSTPLATAKAALAALADIGLGGAVVFGPGVNYDEQIVVDQDNISLLGLGTLRDVAILQSAGVGITITGRNCYLENLDVSGVDAGVGVLVEGDGFTASRCKFENQNNTGIALKFLPSAVANFTASLFLIDDCEFAWAATGIQFNTSTSTCTQGKISRCWFHNLSAAALAEGTASSVRNLAVVDSVFDRLEDGTEPTAYISLAGSGNTGIISRNSFPTAINGGKNTVGTKLIWAGNFMSGGISTAQPSSGS